MDSTLTEIREWQKHHEEDDKERFRGLNERLDKVLEVLEPIAETYRTAGTLGKWVKGLVTFIALILGAIVTWNTLFK